MVAPLVAVIALVLSFHDPDVPRSKIARNSESCTHREPAIFAIFLQSARCIKPAHIDRRELPKIAHAADLQSLIP